MSLPPDCRAQAEYRMDRVMAVLLRGGVSLAAVLVAFGGAIYAAHHGEAMNYHVFRGEPKAYTSFSGVFQEVERFNGRGFIQLGILVLIATPIARVAFSIFAFLRERDWMYVTITLIVMGLLLYGLLSARS